MRDFQDIREEEVLASVEPVEITRELIIEYAGASGDFNPMHVDEVTNLEAGMGGVFAHGMYGTGLLGRLATDYLGDTPLDYLSVRCSEIVRPGDVLHCQGRVVRREVEDTHGVVDLELTAVNQLGEITHAGTARASLPLTRHVVESRDRAAALVHLRAIG